MFSLNIKTEIRNLFRNYWLSAITIILVALCLYSGWNGNRRVEKIGSSISNAKDEMRASDILLAARLDSLNQGYTLKDVPSWQSPHLATATGNYNPRVAALEPTNLTLIATGQSDMFNHYVKPTLNGDSFSIAFTEMTSPVSLLMGNFDPAFVLVYLLPLVIIAFCYNILSSEKEQGSLVLIASSPLSMRVWLLQKVLIRFFVLAILLLICLSGMLILNGAFNVADLLQLTGVTCLYAGFWFALAYFINLRGTSSAFNAISLLGLWVTFVLVIPSLLSQSASVLYPVPSRALLINEMRIEQASIDKEQDKILDNYLRNHPELIVNEEKDSGEGTAYGWWQNYFASKDILEERMTPLIKTYDESLANQQTWVNNLGFLSPTILFQNSLIDMAGTSTAHYNAYRSQVLAFSDEWKAFFLPLVFNDKPFEKGMLAELPEFQFNRSAINSPLFKNSILILASILVLVILSFVATGSVETERLRYR